MSPLTVGVVGTSWWADAMYLPALTALPKDEVVVAAVCGRNRAHAEGLASRWGVPRVFTDAADMLDSGLVRAVVVATPNDTHRRLAGAALQRGLHVLCEKPLGLNHREADELARAAWRAGVTTLVPFTYRFMPTTRYVKRLLERGYIGRPYHLNMRYLGGWGMAPEYSWRFDADRAGSGVIADIGSHFVHLAEWFFGEIDTVSCEGACAVERPHPDGREFRRVEDAAVITLRFTSGAFGVIHVSAVAYEPTPFGQIHEMDLHGSEGTLHHRIDWDRLQVVLGARLGEPLRALEIPDEIWAGAPHEPVKDTYHHVFRDQGLMVGEWARAAAVGRKIHPDFADGARVQRVLDAALVSRAEGRRVRVDELGSDAGVAGSGPRR